MGRYGDMKQRAETERFTLFAYLSGLVGLSVGWFGWFVSLWFTLVRVGSDFWPPIKKFFNFPKFFPNYLIFSAFQI